ncbi:MAG: pirin family protein [Bacteroidota bacterium]
MDRKDFIKKSLLAGIAGSMLPAAAKGDNSTAKNSTYSKLMDQVGFNHVPNQKEIRTMNTVYHKANTRGMADHGWLTANHSFSFAHYYNPDRMNFGVLRVLNDDKIAPSKGFGMHPHDNMEIISIPLEGALEHKDSLGNGAVVQHGDVQVMSAGTGIRHSEFNANTDQDMKLLQIWLFPNKKNVTPRYDQVSIKDIEKKNTFYQVLSPNVDDQGVWIHQDAWFHLGEFDQDVLTTYEVKKPGNGIYVFVIEGTAEITGQALGKRDGFGIWNVNDFEIQADKNSRILLMEVPMSLS